MDICEEYGLCPQDNMRWNQDNIKDAGVKTKRNVIKYAKGISKYQRLYNWDVANITHFLKQRETPSNIWIALTRKPPLLVVNFGPMKIKGPSQNTRFPVSIKWDS